MERHNLWCQSGFRLRHSVSSRSVQDSAARSMGPYLAALPVLPQDGAREGSGGAVGCRDGACGVVGVEGSGGAVGSRDGAWVLLVLRLLSVATGFISVTG